LTEFDLNRSCSAPSSSYFVTIRRGGVLCVGAGGEMVNVTQVF